MVSVPQQLVDRAGMFWVYRALILATISMIAVLSASSPLTAQPATPAPSDCTVERLEPDMVQDAAAGPVPRRAELVPTEEQVSDRELEQISHIVTMMVACTNANQPLRALALVTETYIAEYFAGQDGQDQLGHLIAMSTRSPGPAALEDRLALLSIDDPVRYEDGRIGVTVVTANADAEFTDLLIFVQSNDGWRLDQVVLGEVEGRSATPSPSP